MRFEKDHIHTERMHFKGVGQVYASPSVARVLGWGAVGMLVFGLPTGALLASVSGQAQVGFFAGYGAGGMVGWCAGMVLASLSEKKKSRTPVAILELERRQKLAAYRARWSGRY